jgi:hypothetical protein
MAVSVKEDMDMKTQIQIMVLAAVEAGMVAVEHPILVLVAVDQVI